MPKILTDTEDETPLLYGAVVVWRFDCLERAGYPTEVAVRLAENARVDLHDAVELLKRGCPVDEAERILA